MGRIDEFRKRMESRMAALGGTGEGGEARGGERTWRRLRAT